MSKLPMSQMLKKAKEGGYAVGAFNIFNHMTARAVIKAAEVVDKPVILQTSTGTVKYYGVKELSSMIHELIEQAKVPVYLHLDHCTDLVFAKECVDAGWDAVMIDASKHVIAENIRQTKEVVEYAHERQAEVEGELGVIEGVEEEIQAQNSELASFEECVQYVEESGVDIFAPALGTAHGVYTGTPVIHYDLVKQLGRSLDQPLVCHGGSGLSQETFQRLIDDGIAKVNISTILKQTYIHSAADYLKQHPDESAPLKLEEAMFCSLKEAIQEHIHIFSNGK